MMDAKQLRELVSRVLRYLDPEIPYSEEAVELLMMTAAHESRLGTFLRQVRGPARGIYQMEPATEQHLLKLIKIKSPSLYKKLMDLNLPLDGQDGAETDSDSYHNLAYQTAMARVFYWMKPGAIPKDPRKMAEYAKQFWNTRLGKATVEDYLNAYRSLC